MLTNIVTDANGSSTLGLAVISRFNGGNTVGTTAAAPYPTDATRDSLYGNTGVFKSIYNIFPSFKLTGLDPATTYNLTIYASRADVTDNRETGYTVTGANTGFAALNASGNVTNQANVLGIVPDASRQITISLAATANNNNANHFTYLGVLKIEAIPPQTPLGFTQEPANQRRAEFQSATFMAAVTGAPPYFVQWLSNSLPIPGANQFSYTIPVITLGMNGSLFSVNVGNYAYSITSSNATLRVITDTNPPIVVSIFSGNGQSIDVTFDELVDPTAAVDLFAHGINNDTISPSEVILQPNGMTARLILPVQLTGAYTLQVREVTDLSGNSIVTINLQGFVPGPDAQSFLIDFGLAANTTEHAASPEDPINYWNNVTDAIGTSDMGQVMNMISTANGSTTVGLMMLARFSGGNGNGTLAPSQYPTEATRDSLFGNTELFGTLSNVYPSFKMIGLQPSLAYDFTFYASRSGVADNRETGYTVTGDNSGFGALNAANNITNTVNVAQIRPTASGEVTISLAPTANNNNATHFTYIGVLRIDPKTPLPQFLPAVISGGQMRLEWTGGGQLQWSPTLAGEWSDVLPTPASPYSEEVVPGASRFFRIRKP